MRNAANADAGFDPATGEVAVQDRGFGRYIRGFFGRRWYMNVFNLIYGLGALAMCGLGCWAAIENMILIYAVPQLNAFGCTSPLDASA